MSLGLVTLASVVVPFTVGVSRTAFCHDDVHTHTHENTTSLTVVAECFNLNKSL